MSETWIRADCDFGDPAVRLTLDARSRLGREFRELLAAHSRVTDGKSEWDDQLARVTMKFIERVRPDLAGLILFSVTFSAYRLQHEFLVVHRDLPRQRIGEVPSQRLETCWTCGRPLSAEMGAKRSRQLPVDFAEVLTVEVCSEECVTARRGTASPLAKAVVGPVVDSLIDSGVLPSASFSIDQSKWVNKVGSTEFEKAWEAAMQSLPEGTIKASKLAYPCCEAVQWVEICGQLAYGECPIHGRSYPDAERAAEFSRGLEYPKECPPELRNIGGCSGEMASPLDPATATVDTLHYLWGLAKDQPGYDKEAWKRRQRELENKQVQLPFIGRRREE